MSAPEADGLFDRIRAASAEVVRRARFVRIDDGKLEDFAGVLSRERPPAPTLDPAHHFLRDSASTTAFVLTLNAVNFGSGWFPQLKKRGGLSGYLTLSTALREHFEKEGAFSAAQLARLTASDCAALFGQSEEPPAGELMALFASAWNELGSFLAREHRSRFQGPFEAAHGSAERVVALLARMPRWRDVASYEGFEVPFFKRAQITCADLSSALRGRGLGAFRDLDQTTLFADNLVPHVLRMLGILSYDLQLSTRIDSERLIEPGSPEEVEIRAAALHAVERLVASCGRRGWRTSAHRLDALLWSRGQSPAIKARPRHRTRCTYY